MLNCSRCGKEGGPFVGGYGIPGGLLCMKCVEGLGIELDWARCDCKEPCSECYENRAQEAHQTT